MLRPRVQHVTLHHLEDLRGEERVTQSIPDQCSHHRRQQTRDHRDLQIVGNGSEFEDLVQRREDIGRAGPDEDDGAEEGEKQGLIVQHREHPGGAAVVGEHHGDLLGGFNQPHSRVQEIWAEGDLRRGIIGIGKEKA